MLRLLGVCTLLVACETASPPEPSKPTPAKSVAEPAVAPMSPPKPAGHPHAIDRESLMTPHTDRALLPKHGIAVHTWGLAGDVLIVIDRDASSLRTLSNLMTEGGKQDKTRKLDSVQLDKLMTAAFDAWHEDETGPMPSATDIREDLIVLDGDEAFYLSGHPITTGAGDKTGRPAAGKAMIAIYKAAR